MRTKADSFVRSLRSRFILLHLNCVKVIIVTGLKEAGQMEGERVADYNIQHDGTGNRKCEK